jgi:hypothetical protein
MRSFNGSPFAQNPAATPLNLAQNAVAANTTAVATATVTGARTDSFVIVRPRAALDAGLGVCGARVSALNTVSVTFMNTTAGALPAGAAGLDFDVMVLPSL